MKRNFYHLTFILNALKIQDKGMAADKSGKVGPFYYWSKKELDELAPLIAVDELSCYYGCAVLKLKNEFVPKEFNPKVVNYSHRDAFGFVLKSLPSDAFEHQFTFDVKVEG